MSNLEIFLACILGASLFLVGYVYVLYPIAIFVFSRLFGRVPNPPRIETADLPSVSLLICAYNEQRVIRQRIENALTLNYPRDRFEIVIASDGSTDQTAEIVREYADRGVKLLDFQTNSGKAAALNEAFSTVKGEIVVLSDANTKMEPDSVRRLAEWFTDPSVGVVCGKLVLVDPSTGRNLDGVYWKYETFLKKCESRLGALLGVNGAIYAIRRDLFPGAPTGVIIDDFVIPLQARRESGCRLIYDTRAIAIEETGANFSHEFKRRARIGAGGYQAINMLWPLLSPTHGWVSFTFFSHKFLRWFGPFFLIMAFATNVALLNHIEFRILFASQCAFYALAACSKWIPTESKYVRLLRIPSMFALMNIALLFGFCRWISGTQKGTWKPTSRTDSLLDSPSPGTGS